MASWSFQSLFFPGEDPGYYFGKGLESNQTGQSLELFVPLTLSVGGGIFFTKSASAHRFPSACPQGPKAFGFRFVWSPAGS